MTPKNVFDMEALASALPTIFDQAQATTSTHKKCCISLYKLHTGASTVTEAVNRAHGEEIRLIGEKTFMDTFIDITNRILVVKKGEGTADRLMRFIGSYARYINEKTEPQDEETLASRFIERLLKHLLKGLLAKNKAVRYRILGILSQIMGSLGEIDEDLYSQLRTSLIERLDDKESFVRAQAAVALSKLVGCEDPSEIEDDEQPIVMHLLDSLCYDQAAEVRRAALVHMPVNTMTIPSLLTRARDFDPVTRKLLYTTVLPRLEHPKQLALAQREFIIRQGLGDREEPVRAAAARLLGTWLDACEGDIVNYLKLFDVLDRELAVDALKSVLVTRPDIIDRAEFNESFWNDIQPESSLFARVIVEHCVDTKDEARLDNVLPVVTAIAFQIQSQQNILFEALQQAEDERAINGGDDDSDDGLESSEQRIVDTTFIVEELLAIAAHLDYTDEIGRRKMYSIVREMIAHQWLPYSTFHPCISVLEKLCSGERDLIRLVVEVINEVRYPPTEDVNEDGLGANQSRMSMASTQIPGPSTKAPQDMTPEERAQIDIRDLRCLNLIIATLERISGSFEENSSLEGILGDIIIPAVKRKELLLREKGLIALGLCCLIARNMALSSFQLFLNQIKTAPDQLKVKVIQIVFDVMMSFERDFFERADGMADRVIEFLMQILEFEESKSVQALICLGLSKMMLLGMSTDDRILTALVITFVSPATSDNHELRQCLAYFLPAYCYSSRTNQDRMRSIFFAAMNIVNGLIDELDDEQDMVTSLQFANLFVDWTDPQKVVVPVEEPESEMHCHVDLAIDILKALYDSDRADEDKKILSQILGKLYMPIDLDRQRLDTLYALVVHLQEQCPFEDVAIEKLFVSFKARFEKHYALLLKDYDEKSLFKDEEFRPLFEYMGLRAPTTHRPSSPVESEPPSPASEAGGDSEDEEIPTQIVEEGVTGATATEVSEDETEDIDVEMENKPPSPSPVKKSRGRIAKTSGSSSRSKRGDAQRTHSPQAAAATPKRRKGAKRIRSPEDTKVFTSPEHKKVNRSKRSAAVEPMKPLTNTTNSRATRAASKNGAVSKSSTRRTAQIEPLEDSDEDSGSDDVAILGSPRKPRRVIEKVGWGSSDDI